MDIHPNPVNLSQADSLNQVNPHPPAITHWPRENPRIVMLHYDHLPPGAVPEYRPEGHHVLTLFNLSGAGLATPIDRQDWLDGQSVTLPLQVPGVGFLCPDGVSHAAVWRQPLEATSFCLTTRFVEQVGQSIFGGAMPTLIPRFGLYDAHLYHLAIALKQILSDLQAMPLNQICGDHVMTAMAMYLLQGYGVRPLPPGVDHPLDNARLQHLFAYVEAHLSSQIAPESLAVALDLGEFQLCQAFLSRTGLSLYAYVQQQRQRRARLLLQVSSLPQEEIARCCGYADLPTMIQHLS
jgi:AraC-like DNA-binding protein